MGNLYREEADCSGRAVSVPSKHITVMGSNSEKKGFSSQTKRFTAQHRPTENPGPGSYNLSSSELDSPSFSTKGTTGFVSSMKPPTDAPRHLRHLPGPNVYNLQSSFIKKHDFNCGVSRVFRKPTATHLDTPTDTSPAPNQYHIQYGGAGRFAPPGSSVFISKTKRDPHNINKDLPSPCQYFISDESQRASKAVVSPFRSKTQRWTGLKDNHVPGPGAYSPHRTPPTVRRTGPLSVLTMSAPPLLILKPPPAPGPGHYDVSRDFSCKATVPSAAFASKSERIIHVRRTDSPGPGFYDPYVSSKHSFFYCDSRVWLPV